MPPSPHHHGFTCPALNLPLPPCPLLRAVDEHFDAIVAELLREIGGRLWRSRQASCLALADLLVGRRWAGQGAGWLTGSSATAAGGWAVPARAVPQRPGWVLPSCPQ